MVLERDRPHRNKIRGDLHDLKAGPRVAEEFFGKGIFNSAVASVVRTIATFFEAGSNAVPVRVRCNFVQVGDDELNRTAGIPIHCIAWEVSYFGLFTTN